MLRNPDSQFQREIVDGHLPAPPETSTPVLIAEIILLLLNADQNSDIESLANQLRYAFIALNGRVIPEKLGGTLVKLLIKCKMSYIGDDPVIVFVDLGILFIHNDDGGYTFSSAPWDELEERR